MSSPVGLLQSLQQAQSMLASMYPNGSAASGATDSSTVDAFQQILASLSPSGATAGGILGSGLASGATSSSTAATPSDGPTGADVVADAEKYLGVPYVLDGESNKGIDCSGLVQKTYSDLGITLPRTVHEQKLMGTAVPSLAQAQPGDLIVFKGGGHVAIYEGNDTVIHAPYPGRVVSNEKLWVGDSGIETIRRIVPSAGTATTTGAAGSTATSAGSAPTQTSAAVQAAALAAVQAIVQADYGLLSSSSSSSGSASNAASSASSQLQDAISSLGAATGSDSSTSSTSSTASAASSSSALQTLAMEQSMLAQEEL